MILHNFRLSLYLAFIGCHILVWYSYFSFFICLWMSNAPCCKSCHFIFFSLSRFKQKLVDTPGYTSQKYNHYSKSFYLATRHGSLIKFIFLQFPRLGFAIRFGWLIIDIQYQNFVNNISIVEMRMLRDK